MQDKKPKYKKKIVMRKSEFVITEHIPITKNGKKRTRIRKSSN